MRLTTLLAMLRHHGFTVAVEDGSYLHVATRNGVRYECGPMLLFGSVPGHPKRSPWGVGCRRSIYQNPYALLRDVAANVVGIQFPATVAGVEYCGTRGYGGRYVAPYFRKHCVIVGKSKQLWAASPRDAAMIDAFVDGQLDPRIFADYVQVEMMGRE